MKVVIVYSGLRARMGAGYNMMNDLTVIQATQVLVSCLYRLVAETREK